MFCVSNSDGQPPFWKQRRNLVAFLAFLGFFNVYTLRVNLSVGIVAMTSSSDKLVSGRSLCLMRNFSFSVNYNILSLTSTKTSYFVFRSSSMRPFSDAVCIRCPRMYTKIVLIQNRKFSPTKNICFHFTTL